MDEIRRATNGSVQLQIVQRYKPELNQAKGGRYYGCFYARNHP